MKNRLDAILSLALTTAAVAMAVVFVWQQVSPGAAARLFSPSTETNRPAEPEYHPEWRSWLPKATPMGADTAPVKIIVFTDLECPACSRYHEQVLKKTKEAFSTAAAILLIHLPLRMHRFSKISAIASECAAQQGRFLEFVELLFQRQDSIGLKAWKSFALEAGVPDQDKHQACVEDQSGTPFQRVAAGSALANDLGITATPTIFVNGWRLPKLPGDLELAAMIQDLLDGKKPLPPAAK